MDKITHARGMSENRVASGDDGIPRLDAGSRPWDPLNVQHIGYHNVLPTCRVVWGTGAVTCLADEARLAGMSRVLLLTTQSLSREQSLLASVEETLGPLLAEHFDQVTAHVPTESVKAAMARCRARQVDGLITFGGGSVIDTGKAVVAELVRDGNPRIRHLALPTTLSGAEFSHFYGVTDLQEFDDSRRASPFKRSFAKVATTPAVVLLDPGLTVATPDALWSSSGIKALDHAIEGLVGSGHQPITTPLALVGIRGIATSLAASRDREAIETRLHCQIAAWQCYFAPATIRLGLSHRLGHVLGGSYHVPHSLTSCITLAPVMRTLAKAVPGKLAAIANALSSEQPLVLEPVPDVQPLEAASRLETLIASLGLPTRLQDVGIRRSDLPAICDLMVHHYPDEVAQLGTDAILTLTTLLEEMW